MDAQAVRTFVNEHLEGVEIRTIDGTAYRIPHRDYVWFTPAFGQSKRRVGRLAKSFWLHDTEHEQARLINALVVEIVPIGSNGRGGSGRGGRPKHA